MAYIPKHSQANLPILQGFQKLGNKWKKWIPILTGEYSPWTIPTNPEGFPIHLMAGQLIQKVALYGNEFLPTECFEEAIILLARQITENVGYKWIADWNKDKLIIDPSNKYVKFRRGLDYGTAYPRIIKFQEEHTGVYWLYKCNVCGLTWVTVDKGDSIACWVCDDRLRRQYKLPPSERPLHNGWRYIGEKYYQKYYSGTAEWRHYWIKARLYVSGYYQHNMYDRCIDVLMELDELASQ